MPMLFSRFIIRPRLQERPKTALAVVGVALGVAVMLAIQLANQGALMGFRSALDAVSGKAALEITAPPLGVDETLLPDLAWLRRYGTATPIIEADVTADFSGEKSLLRIIGVDALRDPNLRDYALTDGAPAVGGMELMTFLKEPNSLVISRAFAEPHQLQANDTVNLMIGDQFHVCRVAAILGSTTSSLAAQSIAIMDIATAQDLLGQPGRVDRLELRLHEGEAVAEVERVLREKLPASLTVQRPQRRGAAVEKMLAAFHFNLTMLSGIALVVGLFLIYNTVSVAVMTRRAEIGMLRTLGVTRSQILRLFITEALLLGSAGAVIGVPLAKVLATAAIGLTSTTVDTLYVATAARVPDLDGSHWAIGLGVAIPLALVAALLPALEAARVPPIAAIRENSASHSHGKTGIRQRIAWVVVLAITGWVAAQQPTVAGLPMWGYFTCFCAIIAMAVAVPPILKGMAVSAKPLLGKGFGIEGRLACGQIAASTNRLSISVAALAVSLALTVAIAIMVGSFRNTVLYWVDQSMGADLYLRPGTPPRSLNPPTFSPDTISLLRAHPDVETFESYRAMDLPFRDRMVKLGTNDFQQLIEHPRLALKTPGEPSAILQKALASDAVLVSESFALRFRLKENDTVTLRTSRGDRTFRIAAQFYDYANDSGSLLMDRHLFESDFGQGLPTHVAIYLKPGTDAAKVRDDMLRMLEGKAFIAIFTNAGLRDEVLRIFDSTFSITWAVEIIAIFVAMLGVAATILTLVLERREEIRLLRIAGADASQVRRIILLESGLIGAVSQALGIVVGLLLSLVLIHVINPQSFGWSIQYHTPWAFLIATTVITIAATLLAGFYPAWRATRDPLQSAQS